MPTAASATGPFATAPCARWWRTLHTSLPSHPKAAASPTWFAAGGRTTSEFIWFATASPALPGTTGDRYFVTNHEGVTFYTSEAPFELNNIDCTIPATVRPVGR